MHYFSSRLLENQFTGNKISKCNTLPNKHVRFRKLGRLQEKEVKMAYGSTLIQTNK